MQIEVGEYKTRDGREVKIVATEDGVAIGYIVKNGVIGGLSTWRADNGRFCLDCDADHSDDIINTKPKRIKKKVWVTVYKDCFFAVGGGYDSLEDAKRKITDNCVAITRVEIDCEEGENLD